MRYAFNRFTARSVFGLRAERDAAIAELHAHGWAPGLPFTLAELGGLQPAPVVSADEMRALGSRVLHDRSLEGGKPIAIVSVHRAWPANLNVTTSAVALRLGLAVDVMRTGRIWLAVWRRRGEG